MSPRLRSYLRRHARSYAIGLLLGTASAVLLMLGPHVLRLAVDAIAAGASPFFLLRYAGALIGLNLAVWILRYYMRMHILGISRVIEYEIRNDYFAHLQRMHVGFFQHTRIGDLMTRAVSDLSTVQRFIGPGIMHFTSTVVMAAIAVGFMLTIDLTLTLYMLVILPLVSLTFIVLGPPIHRQYESVQEQFSVISAHAQENFSGIRVIKAFAQEPHEAEAFAAHNREYIRRNLAVIKTEGALWPLMSFFLGLAAVVLLWQGGQAVIAGRITLGQFVQFIGYLGQLSWPMVALGWVVSLIPRLFESTTGSVLVDGVDVRRYRMTDLRRCIGMVPQDTFMFTAPLSENIAYGLEAPEPDPVRVREAAELAHLAVDVAGFPNGYDTMVGERGVTLSGGQKQRAAIARAIARDPRILILDDALSSVDTSTEEEILRELRAISGTRTTIIISHRISTVRHADQIVVLDKGRIVQRGTHDTLLGAGGLYADLYQKQLLEEELEAADLDAPV